MGDHEVSYLVVSIYDKKIRMNYASNDLTLSQIVEDAFIDYLTFEEGLDEVPRFFCLLALCFLLLGFINTSWVLSYLFKG